VGVFELGRRVPRPGRYGYEGFQGTGRCRRDEKKRLSCCLIEGEMIELEIPDG
jgi:hypothetical protein